MTELRAAELARQDKIFTLFCTGKTRKEIASELGCTYNTVASHLYHCGITRKREQMVRDRRMA